MIAQLSTMSGSYRPQDCLFLFTPLAPHYTSVEEKEALIQSGQRHYSEMISYEHPPSQIYRELFNELTDRYKYRLASEVLEIAQQALANRSAPLTIVSLARAGTPFGALLNRAFRDVFQVDSEHYSISIIRDRGIDKVALEYILRERGRDPQGLFFVDTWTAKGVITGELKEAIAQWNATEPEQLKDELFVISDIGGTADYAATYDDYAIPSGVMNATVSGLMSRSILNDSISDHQFHGSVYYEHLMAYDQSQWFLDEVSAHFKEIAMEMRETQQDRHRAQKSIGQACRLSLREERRVLSKRWIDHWIEAYQISDINYIKPGVAEATRVMLRRVPACLLISEPDHPDIAHLKLLALDKKVPIIIEPEMPFKAAAFIKALTLAGRDHTHES